LGCQANLDQITTRLDNSTGTYARTGLGQLTELLIDLNDLLNRYELTKRRTLNRALFTRITINAEENAAYAPNVPTASILAQSASMRRR